MADDKKDAQTNEEPKQSKAAQDREAYFYEHHAPPPGYQVQVVGNKLEITKVEDDT